VKTRKILAIGIVGISIIVIGAGIMCVLYFYPNGIESPKESLKAQKDTSHKNLKRL
jgi:hypothetical protein